MSTTARWQLVCGTKCDQSARDNARCRQRDYLFHAFHWSSLKTLVTGEMQHFRGPFTAHRHYITADNLNQACPARTAHSATGTQFVRAFQQHERKRGSCIGFRIVNVQILSVLHSVLLVAIFKAVYEGEFVVNGRENA